MTAQPGAYALVTEPNAQHVDLCGRTQAATQHVEPHPGRTVGPMHTRDDRLRSFTCYASGCEIQCHAGQVLHDAGQHRYRVEKEPCLQHV